MDQTGPARPAWARDAARTVLVLALVVGVAALALAALDEVPGWLTGDRPGVSRFESIDGAERAMGARLYVPAYFPNTLRWPPSSIRVFDGPPASSALVFDGRDGRPGRLAVYQAPGARASIAMALMPSARVLHETDVDLGAGSARLLRVQLPDGRVGNDLVWYRPDETLALRYGGSADELLRIAHSLRRRRP